MSHSVIDFLSTGKREGTLKQSPEAGLLMHPLDTFYFFDFTNLELHCYVSYTVFKVRKGVNIVGVLSDQITIGLIDNMDSSQK